MIVPSHDFWKRDEFLRARAAQTAAHANGEIDCLCDDPFFAGAEEIVIDAGDDVVCDTCNAEITEDIINLVEYGRRVVCDTCYQKHYANEPRKFRRVNRDGTLGSEVKP